MEGISETTDVSVQWEKKIEMARGSVFSLISWCSDAFSVFMLLQVFFLIKALPEKDQTSDLKELWVFPSLRETASVICLALLSGSFTFFLSSSFCNLFPLLAFTFKTRLCILMPSVDFGCKLAAVTFGFLTCQNEDWFCKDTKKAELAPKNKKQCWHWHYVGDKQMFDHQIITTPALIFLHTDCNDFCNNWI